MRNLRRPKNNRRPKRKGHVRWFSKSSQRKAKATAPYSSFDKNLRDLFTKVDAAIERWKISPPPKPVSPEIYDIEYLDSFDPGEGLELCITFMRDQENQGNPVPMNLKEQLHQTIVECALDVIKGAMNRLRI